jgi:3-hydroxybutyrate dehydrogenase
MPEAAPATTGITCNAICPAWVLTPRVQKQIDDLARREGLAPEAALFLCSPAAAQIRGIALPVDGGWTAQ